MLSVPQEIQPAQGSQPASQLAVPSTEGLPLSEQIGHCRKQFVALAGLFNHLESESCEYMRCEKVQQAHRQLTEALTGPRTIGFSSFAVRFP